MKKDDFGDRMQDYEAAETKRLFMPLLPIYARIDGRCFSRFTHGLDRPFDLRITHAMVRTTKFLVEETHARIGYTQSDEISLVWQQDRYDSEVFFGGKVRKMVSVLAGLATARFNHLCFADGALRERVRRTLPVFDCRVFPLPNRTEAANAFLWREKDATRNAIGMAARSFYPHKQLHGKTGSEMQELLFRKGRNFNDDPAFFKRGTFVRRITKERPFTPEELRRIPKQHRPAPNAGDPIARRRDRHARLRAGAEPGGGHLRRGRAARGLDCAVRCARACRRPGVSVNETTRGSDHDRAQTRQHPDGERRRADPERRRHREDPRPRLVGRRPRRANTGPATSSSTARSTRSCPSGRSSSSSAPAASSRPRPTPPGRDRLPAGFRIKTVKLRGQVSQGICFPLSILPPGAPDRRRGGRHRPARRPEVGAAAARSAWAAR